MMLAQHSICSVCSGCSQLLVLALRYRQLAGIARGKKSGTEVILNDTINDLSKVVIPERVIVGHIDKATTSVPLSYRDRLRYKHKDEFQSDKYVTHSISARRRCVWQLVSE